MCRIPSSFCSCADVLPSLQNYTCAGGNFSVNEAVATLIDVSCCMLHVASAENFCEAN